MKLSTGKIAFTVEFDNGDKGVICFNPNDKGIHERIQGFENSLEKRIKEIDHEKYKSRLSNDLPTIEIENAESLFDMSIDELKALHSRIDVVNEIEEKYNKAVKDELDFVFGSQISDVAFRYCQPFDIVILEDESQEVYIMHFLHWLMDEIQKHGTKNKSAMDKHLAKYSK